MRIEYVSSLRKRKQPGNAVCCPFIKGTFFIVPSTERPHRSSALLPRIQMNIPMV